MRIHTRKKATDILATEPLWLAVWLGKDALKGDLLILALLGVLVDQGLHEGVLFLMEETTQLVKLNFKMSDLRQEKKIVKHLNKGNEMWMMREFAERSL
jgi:hypothetical protein